MEKKELMVTVESTKKLLEVSRELSKYLIDFSKEKEDPNNKEFVILGLLNGQRAALLSACHNCIKKDKDIDLDEYYQNIERYLKDEQGFNNALKELKEKENVQEPKEGVDIEKEFKDKLNDLMNETLTKMSEPTISLNEAADKVTNILDSVVTLLEDFDKKINKGK